MLCVAVVGVDIVVVDDVAYKGVDADVMVS